VDAQARIAELEAEDAALRAPVAAQAINRGMSIEAIAALLGHRSLDMTMTYARFAPSPTSTSP
jgi:site-specific recombinase XerD